LEDEDGKPISDDYLVIEFGSLPSGKDSPISSLIDAARYYDTLLNPIQAEALADEIVAAGESFLSTLEPLVKWAREISGSHAHLRTYLRFVGD